MSLLSAQAWLNWRCCVDTDVAHGVVETVRKLLGRWLRSVLISADVSISVPSPNHDGGGGDSEGDGGTVKRSAEEACSQSHNGF